MSVGVRLKACLLLLGFADDNAVEWDHDPALQLRTWDEEAGDTIPKANDPRYIVPRLKADHARKTNGTKATTRGSDQHETDRANRLANAHEAFRKAMTVPAFKRKDDKPKSRWPKQKMRSRNSFKQRRNP